MKSYLTTAKDYIYYNVHFKTNAIVFLCLFCFSCLFRGLAYAQTPKQLKSKLALYFDNYTTDTYTSNEKIKIENIVIEPERRISGYT